MLFFCLSLRAFAEERFKDYDSSDSSEGSEDEGRADEDGAGEGEEGIDESERRYRWLRQIDEVAHTKRVSWDDVWRMGVIEFYNIVDYIKEKNRREQEAMKQWQVSHRH